MLSVGVDIIEIERIGRAISRWDGRFLQRVYTGAELALCRGRVPELAVRFAGKEAISKALGTGLFGVSWREMEILADVRGKPLVYLYGRAAQRAAVLGLTEFAISLSHSRDNAVAFVASDGIATASRPHSGEVATASRHLSGEVATESRVSATAPRVVGGVGGIASQHLGASMDKIDNAFRSKLQERPHQTVRLIVRVKGDLTPAMARLAKLDVTVLRSFHLINAVAISCSAQTALDLTKEAWVQQIEKDRRVSVQKPDSSSKGGRK
jgi:holo-[acyl-carrier protein] synthase